MRFQLLLSSLLIMVSACQTVPYQRITKQAIFIEKVAGKSLSWPGGYRVQFSRAGTISGNFPDGVVTGKWHWQEGFFCRSIRINGIPKPDECLEIEYNGNQIRFKRNNGSYFLPYRIEQYD